VDESRAAQQPEDPSPAAPLRQKHASCPSRGELGLRWPAVTQRKSPKCARRGWLDLFPARLEQVIARALLCSPALPLQPPAPARQGF